MDFSVTNTWVRSLYRRMNLTRRVATTSRPVITHALWDELRTHFLHSIADFVATYNIPDELIFNIDQTPSKCFKCKELGPIASNSPKGLNLHERISLKASTAVVMAACRGIVLVETAILVE